MIRLVGSLLVVAAMASTASAGIMDAPAPGFSFAISSDGTSGSNNGAADFGAVTQVGLHEWFYTGALNQPGIGSLSWAYLVDPDPFITGSLELTNTTGASHDYIIDFTLNIDPVLNAGSYIAGQFGGTLTDANGNGSASLTSIGSVYTALGDGAAIQGLMNNASQAVSSPWGTTSFSGGQFGYPIGSMTGPAIETTIGIRYAFTLSAGDSISFSSIFVANPVPGPGALALMAMAGMVGGRRRRR